MTSIILYKNSLARGLLLDLVNKSDLNPSEIEGGVSVTIIILTP